MQEWSVACEVWEKTRAEITAARLVWNKVSADLERIYSAWGNVPPKWKELEKIDLFDLTGSLCDVAAPWDSTNWRDVAISWDHTNKIFYGTRATLNDATAKLNSATECWEMIYAEWGKAKAELDKAYVNGLSAKTALKRSKAALRQAFTAWDKAILDLANGQAAITALFDRWKQASVNYERSERAYAEAYRNWDLSLEVK